jgi:hypothetical protein
MHLHAAGCWRPDDKSALPFPQVCRPKTPVLA